MSLILCLLAVLAWARPAAAEEYRLITLADGRVLQAEIIATTAQGLSLRIPQGRLDVPFASVRNLEAMDAVAYRSQPTWRVLILPFAGPDTARAEEARASVEDALGRIPAITVGNLDGLARAGASVEALRACGQDLSCAVAPAGAAGFTAVVSGSLAPKGASTDLTLSGVFSGAPSTRRSETTPYTGLAGEHPVEILKAAAAALQLRPEDAVVATLPARLGAPVAASPWGTTAAPDVPAPVAAPTGPVATTPWGTTPEPAPTPDPAPTATAPPVAPAAADPSLDRLRRLAWVPLPGMPSIARKDWSGVAKSWGLVVPGSAAMVYVSGRAAFTAPQMVGMSALSVYSLTVLANTVFGLHGASAGVSPTADGGAAVGVSVPLGGTR